MIEPMSVCELEAGSPSHHVPRFQITAASSSANTIARPALLLTWRINSTGSSDTMPQATAPEAIMTPKKFHRPDHTTATCGVSERV